MKKIIVLLCSFLSLQWGYAQKFNLFSQEMRDSFPSVVYDFLERYLYEVDSLERHHQFTDQKLHDDKVIFLSGSAASARKIPKDHCFDLKMVDSKYYQATWSDTLGNVLLDMAFPMQYELLLFKPKVEIEKNFKSTIMSYSNFQTLKLDVEGMTTTVDGCLMSESVRYYYVESMNTAVYCNQKDDSPTFSREDKWHSVANLFQGSIGAVDGYNIYVVQNLYGFKTCSYTIPLKNWLAYCQAMKLTTYLAVEEEREDGLKCILIAQSRDLGFNHMLSLIIPDDFVENSKAVFKATLNAYIPTQNVKDLYKKYVDRPKKRI